MNMANPSSSHINRGLHSGAENSALKYRIAVLWIFGKSALSKLNTQINVGVSFFVVITRIATCKKTEKMLQYKIR